MKKKSFLACIVIFFCIIKISGMNYQSAQLPSADSLWGAAINNDTDTILKIVKLGLPINQPCGIPPRTPLYWAAAFGSTDAVQTLLKIQADPNLRFTKNDETPLVIAAITGYPDIVQLLLAYHADSHMKCQWDPERHLQLPDQTALEWALKRHSDLQKFSAGNDATKELYAGALQKLDAVITILEEHERSLDQCLVS
jgi:hypothetical protein